MADNVRCTNQRQETSQKGSDSGRKSGIPIASRSPGELHKPGSRTHALAKQFTSTKTKTNCPTNSRIPQLQQTSLNSEGATSSLLTTDANRKPRFTQQLLPAFDGSNNRKLSSPSVLRNPSNENRRLEVTSNLGATACAVNDTHTPQQSVCNIDRLSQIPFPTLWPDGGSACSLFSGEICTTCDDVEATANRATGVAGTVRMSSSLKDSRFHENGGAVTAIDTIGTPVPPTLKRDATFSSSLEFKSISESERSEKASKRTVSPSKTVVTTEKSGIKKPDVVKLSTNRSNQQPKVTQKTAKQSSDHVRRMAAKLNFKADWLKPLNSRLPAGSRPFQAAPSSAKTQNGNQSPKLNASGNGTYRKPAVENCPTLPAKSSNNRRSSNSEVVDVQSPRRKSEPLPTNSGRPAGKHEFTATSAAAYRQNQQNPPEMVAVSDFRQDYGLSNSGLPERDSTNSQMNDTAFKMSSLAACLPNLSAFPAQKIVTTSPSATPRSDFNCNGDAVERSELQNMQRLTNNYRSEAVRRESQEEEAGCARSTHYDDVTDIADIHRERKRVMRSLKRLTSEDLARTPSTGSELDGALAEEVSKDCNVKIATECQGHQAAAEGASEDDDAERITKMMRWKMHVMWDEIVNGYASLAKKSRADRVENKIELHERIESLRRKTDELARLQNALDCRDSDQKLPDVNVAVVDEQSENDMKQKLRRIAAMFRTVAASSIDQSTAIRLQESASNEVTRVRSSETNRTGLETRNTSDKRREIPLHAVSNSEGTLTGSGRRAADTSLETTQSERSVSAATTAIKPGIGACSKLIDVRGETLHRHRGTEANDPNLLSSVNQYDRDIVLKPGEDQARKETPTVSWNNNATVLPAGNHAVFLDCGDVTPFSTQLQSRTDEDVDRTKCLTAAKGTVRNSETFDCSECRQLPEPVGLGTAMNDRRWQRAPPTRRPAYTESVCNDFRCQSFEETVERVPPTETRSAPEVVMKDCQTSATKPVAKYSPLSLSQIKAPVGLRQTEEYFTDRAQHSPVSILGSVETGSEDGECSTPTSFRARKKADFKSWLDIQLQKFADDNATEIQQHLLQLAQTTVIDETPAQREDCSPNLGARAKQYVTSDRSQPAAPRRVATFDQPPVTYPPDLGPRSHSAVSYSEMTSSQVAAAKAVSRAGPVNATPKRKTTPPPSPPAPASLSFNNCRENGSGGHYGDGSLPSIDDGVQSLLDRRLLAPVDFSEGGFQTHPPVCYRDKDGYWPLYPTAQRQTASGSIAERRLLTPCDRKQMSPASGPG